MARKIEVEIVGDASSLQRAFRGSERSATAFNARMSSASAGLSRFAKSAAIAGAAVGVGLTALAVKGVKAASDLNEQINKSEVVFGSSAKAIEAWSKTTSSALGLSQRQALEAAGGFGAMLETAGLTEGVAAKFSKRLVGLAADMASFNNIDPSEALLKLKSGLAGEAEPLRTVGVLLSEARVKQEAYRAGIAKSGAELTEQQKVQARYNLILKDTAKQQGDFARTSKSFANAQRIVRANFEDLAAQIGSVFLPAVAKVTSGFADFLSELGKAKTARAKLNVVLETGRDIGSQVLKVAEEIRQRVGDALAQIDWRDVGRQVGDGLARGLQAVAAFVGSVDWGKVGTAVVRGIVDFLKGVPWGPLLKATGILIVKAIIALDSLLFAAAKELGGAIIQGIRAGIGALAHLAVEGLKKLPDAWLAVAGFYLEKAKALGKAIIGGIGRGLDGAKNFVLRKLLAFVNKILGVTGFLGRFDPFKGVREKVQGRLKQMEGDAKGSSSRIQGSINGIKGKSVTVKVNEDGTREVQSAIDGVKGKTVTITVKTLTGDNKGGRGGRAPTGGPDFKNPAPAKAVAAAKQVAADDVAEANRIRSARQAQAKAIKAAATAAAKAKEAAIAAFALLLDSLSLSGERAATTKGFRDDLKVLNQQEKAIRDEIKVEGRTTDLLRQLFQVGQDRKAINEQIRQQRAESRQGKQFKALGLTKTGEKPVASVAALTKRLGTLKNQIKGTILDTPKTQSQLAQIAKVLAGKFGKVGKDVRAAILQMFADIAGGLSSKGSGPLTKTTSLNSKKLLAGLGLSPEQIRELRGRLSGFNSAGLALAGGGGLRQVSGGFEQPRGGAIVVESHTTINLDGHKIASSVTRNQQKTRRRNPQQKRGPHRRTGGV